MKRPIFKSITDSNGISITVENGKSTTNAPLSNPVKIYCTPKRYTNEQLNTVCLSPELYARLKNKCLVLLNASTQHVEEIEIKQNSALQGNNAILTNTLKELLCVGTEFDDELYILEKSGITYNSFFKQKVGGIKDNSLTVSPQGVFPVPNNIEENGFSLYNVSNCITGQSFIVKKEHIIFDPTLPKGTMRLTRKQRIFLGLQVPKFLSAIQLEHMESVLCDEDLKAVKAAYSKDEMELIDDISFVQKRELQDIFDKKCGFKVYLHPVTDSYCVKNRRGFKAISDFFVGKSTTSLICCRPYENDEGADVIRMSRSNMQILGIDEMDQVILQYKNKKAVCRVLELNDTEAFFTTNRYIDTDLAIGVPAHIRRALGIFGLNAVIKVDRDTSFIFKKSVNEQILPVLLTLFSINLFRDSSVIISALLSALSIPVVVYLNLSSKRNMRCP